MLLYSLHTTVAVILIVIRALARDGIIVESLARTVHKRLPPHHAPLMDLRLYVAHGGGRHLGLLVHLRHSLHSLHALHHSGHRHHHRHLIVSAVYLISRLTRSLVVPDVGGVVQDLGGDTAVRGGGGLGRLCRPNPTNSTTQYSALRQWSAANHVIRCIQNCF